MVEVKGVFIKFVGLMMALNKDQLKKANNQLNDAIGLDHHELDPEGWYDIELCEYFIDEYKGASVTGDEALVILGRRVFPMIKAVYGLPSELITPRDLIRFTGQILEKVLRGRGIASGKFLKEDEGYIVMLATVPEGFQKLFQGVLLGILEMFGINTGRVTMTKRNPGFEYVISWYVRKEPKHIKKKDSLTSKI